GSSWTSRNHRGSIAFPYSSGLSRLSQQRFAEPMFEPRKVTASNPPPWWRPAMPGLVLLLLVAAAYFPALRGEFIWDDDYNVIKSKPLRSVEGLLRIWFEPGATQQYYPLTHTSFWLDYHLWGLHPLAYHAENILLHAL